MDRVRQTFAHVFGVLGMASLLCVAVGAIVAVAGIPLEYLASGHANIVEHWWTCLLDGGLMAAIAFGWLYHRVEKKQQDLRQAK
jgi:hypothetical protein